MRFPWKLGFYFKFSIGCSEFNARALETDSGEFSGHFGTKHSIFHAVGTARIIKMKSNRIDILMTA